MRLSERQVRWPYTFETPMNISIINYICWVLLLQIAECVAFIESKLAELEKDRAELVEFQKLDKTKRSIEYALRDRELEDSRAQLAKVGFKRFVANRGLSRLGCGHGYKPLVCQQCVFLLYPNSSSSRVGYAQDFKDLCM
jgi:hypothetical protein